MAYVDPRALKALNSFGEAEAWLIGWDHNHVINVLPDLPISEVQSFLPGGLRVIGRSFFKNNNQDYLLISKDLQVSPALFLTKTDEKYLAHIVEPPLLYQKEVTLKNSPSFFNLHSKSTIPVFDLNLKNFEFLQSVLFGVNGNVFASAEGNSWQGLGVKNKTLVPVEVYFEVTTEGEGHAPCLELNPSTRAYSLSIHWCSSVLESMTVSSALDLHLEKLKQLLNQILETLKTNPSKSATCCSFSNDFIVHPVNVLFFYLDWNEESAELLAQRKNIHQIFNLPEDFPLVRSSCGLKENEGFRDVHLSLLEMKPNDVGVKHAVKGHLAYFHYAQDGFDDKGWGCAYRSLQTLISWLKEQNYWHNEIPSHYQVQKLLVELGDKPKEFIGSKDWIGAYEVMLVLDSYCKVPCRILNLTSGGEISSKGRELACHFDNEGSPVMIGGGVLAYTLLGVDYNEDTGDCRYLILDPHYVGSDNLSTVLSKGWCGWKGPEVFRTDCFYNLCMPIRPRYI
jgi:hypothetical protein